MDSCLETKEGCAAFKQGECTIDGNSLIHHISSTDQADCQVILFAKVICTNLIPIIILHVNKMFFLF